ncbi:MAG: Holliday junction resolvase YqgF, putative holliday junction resolvase [Parcubacteria group bacterium]|nr:Holliday junction resolvase YqgF, putative holliday junction resolvase [Parcubacteria group bacterium]
MKVLAVDYGAKRVGIASTDDSGEFALPRVVLPNNELLLPEVLKLIREGNIEKVVIGESKNLDGSRNQILDEAEKFGDALKGKGIEVVFHPEVYSSMEADRLQGQNAMRDASAAAIILKSYIDSHK